MAIEIIDLEEYSKSKKRIIKLGKFEIDVNEFSLKMAIKVADYHNRIVSGEGLDSETILENIVIPIILAQNENSTREDIENNFNYDQLMKVWSMIFDAFIKAGVDNEESQNNKKKEKLN